MTSTIEYVKVPLPMDEDEPTQLELESGDYELPAGSFYEWLTSDGSKLLTSMGVSCEEEKIDPNDPRLTQEVSWCDPSADAFADTVTLRIMDAEYIAVDWQ